jgi:hypothetical protein
MKITHHRLQLLAQTYFVSLKKHPVEISPGQNWTLYQICTGSPCEECASSISFPCKRFFFLWERLPFSILNRLLFLSVAGTRLIFCRSQKIAVGDKKFVHR